MILKQYILTTVRLIADKWWLSLIKLCSLTVGIISFLLIWLFYIEKPKNTESFSVSYCSIESLALIVFVLLMTTFIYFMIMKSQISVRQKELFWRKYYGETNLAIIIMLMIETSIFIIASFVLSLVLVDQVVPFFNLVTDKNISVRQLDTFPNFIMIVVFLLVLGFTVGILPALWYAKSKTGEILHRL